MKREAIFHRPRNEWAYYGTDGCAELTLRTARDDMRDVTVCWFDKYCIETSKSAVEMELFLEDDTFSWFRAKVRPPYRRLQYYFRLTDTDGRTAYFDEQGLHADDSGCLTCCFQLPYLNREDAVTIPDWAQDAVFYQIFPDSFARAGRTDDTELPPWGSEPHIINPLGGNIRGIIEHMDYLTDLGINAVYFCPLFQSNTCHRYNTYDYRRIDPLLGTLEDFQELLDTCHGRGIRVILDAVFNHTCDTFPYFDDVIKNGENSEYKDWYFINEYPVAVDEEYRYERFSFERHMPKLNTANPETRDYLLDIVAYWTRMGIDGWRLDVANEVNMDFWRSFRRVVKGLNPDALIIGEVWGDSMPYLQGDMFDSVMNYPFAYACQDYFLDRKTSTSEFYQIMTERLVCYPQPMEYAMYNLLGSHDTPRWLSIAKEDEKKVILSVVFQFFFVGMPAVYYGDETGMLGDDFIEARRCMDFEPAGDTGKRLHALCKYLIRLRGEYAALRRGSLKWLTFPGAGLLGVRREYKGESLTLILNNSDESANFRLPFASSDQKPAAIEPMGYKIFINNKEVIR